MNHFFLTGSTGNLGVEILRVLLAEQEARVSLLVRAQSYQSGKRRVQELLSFLRLSYEDYEGRLDIYVGDLSDEFFGLEVEKYRKLCKSVTHVIHSAASVRLSQTEDEAFRQVIVPTSRIIEFLKYSNQVSHFGLVSSVGVAGRDYLELPESLSIRPSEFRNSYEKSKYFSERLVLEELSGRVPISIHRPSMIIGKSNTGEVLQFQIFYSICQLLTGSLTRGIVPDVRTATLDTIPVDWVAKGVVEAALQENAPPLLHHCAGPEEAVTFECLAKIVSEVWGSSNEVKYQGVGEFRQTLGAFTALMPREIEKKLRFVPHFLEYFSENQTFINTNSKALLQSWGITYDNLGRALEKSLRFHSFYSEEVYRVGATATQ